MTVKRTKEVRLNVTRRVVVRSTQIEHAGLDVKQEEAREDVIPNDATKDCGAALSVLLPNAPEPQGGITPPGGRRALSGWKRLANLLRLFQGAKV